jgi:hypothetical protein
MPAGCWLTVRPGAPHRAAPQNCTFLTASLIFPMITSPSS